MPLMSMSMKSSFKPMFVILPIFLLLYYWIMPHMLVMMPQVFGSTTKTAVMSLFFIAVFVLGMAASFVVLAYDKKMAAMEAFEQGSAGGSSQNNAI
jgi:uncharacterized membrane protein